MINTEAYSRRRLVTLFLSAKLAALTGCAPQPSPTQRPIGEAATVTPIEKPITPTAFPTTTPSTPNDTPPSTPESPTERYQRIITEEASKRGPINKEEALLWLNAKNEWKNAMQEKDPITQLKRKMDIAFILLNNSENSIIQKTLQNIDDMRIDFVSSSRFPEEYTELTAIRTEGKVGTQQIARTIVVSDDDLLAASDPEELIFRVVNHVEYFKVSKELEDGLLKESARFRNMDASQRSKTVDDIMKSPNFRNTIDRRTNIQEVEAYLWYRSQTGRLSPEGVDADYLRITAEYIQLKNNPRRPNEV